MGSGSDHQIGQPSAGDRVKPDEGGGAAAARPGGEGESPFSCWHLSSVPCVLGPGTVGDKEGAKAGITF